MTATLSVMVDDRTLTVAEVAGRLRVMESTVREMLRTGSLRGYRIGGPRAGWRILESDLQQFIESRMNQER